MAFFIKRNDQINGPFTADQIKSGVATGKLKDMDLISSSKEGPWASLSPAVGKAPAQAEKKTAGPSKPRQLSPSGEQEIQLAPLEQSFTSVHMARQQPATAPRPVTAPVPVPSPVATGARGNHWKIPIIAGVVTLLLSCVAAIGIWHLAGSSRADEEAVEAELFSSKMAVMTISLDNVAKGLVAPNIASSVVRDGIEAIERRQARLSTKEGALAFQNELHKQVPAMTQWIESAA